MPEFRVYLVGVGLLLMVCPATAEPINPAREYSTCLAAAHTNPQEGLAQAQRWEGLGGGEAARHCAAAALFELGSFAESAKRLEALVQESRQEAPVRAGMLRQAGRAWFMAHEPEKAYAAQSTGLKLAPNDLHLRVDRAATLAELKNYQEAIADLDQALQLQSDRPDALLFRATAYRFVGENALAARDIERLLSLNPGNVDGLLERGIQARLAGRPEVARKDWLKVLQIDPTSSAAEAARRNIEMMDVKEKK